MKASEMRIIESDVYWFRGPQLGGAGLKESADKNDQSAASGQMMQDRQANNAGYNYNNWYQVSPPSRLPRVSHDPCIRCSVDCNLKSSEINTGINNRRRGPANEIAVCALAPPTT